jgi:hypothetical protein
MSATGTVMFVALAVAAVAYVMWFKHMLSGVSGILALTVALAIVVAVGAGLLRAFVWMMTALESGV